jgi:hypothetical protein
VTWVVLEYLEPVSPANRRAFDPCGDGPLVFDGDESAARDLFTRLGGAPSPFRVVPVEYAKKMGLL